MVIIVASAIALASEDPINPNSQRNRILSTIDYIFTAAFILEFLLKVVDFGWVSAFVCLPLMNIIQYKTYNKAPKGI